MKKIDFVGRRFSHLLVLRPAPGRETPQGQKKAYWLCRCDCGNEVEIAAALFRPALKPYGAFSCGCLRRSLNSKKVDLAGKRFGRLGVVQAAPSRRGRVRGEIRNFWLCRCSCGQEKEISSSSLRAGYTRSCGCLAKEVFSRRGEKSPNFKGGRTKNKDGYVLLLRPEFPGSATYKKRGGGIKVPEHLVVMMRHLGRPLHKDETVHHRNGIRDDNRIENLELKASSHGRGQTVPDLVAWAKEILTRYGPGTPPKIISPCCV